MSLNITSSRTRLQLAAQDGFTLVIALGVMLVTSLLLVAAFTAVNGDIALSHKDTTQKQAYFAAVSGVQEYTHKLQANSDYWQTACEGPHGKVPGEENESYETSVLPANGHTVCETTNPFATMIESSGSNANTFRIKSVGTAGTDKRTIIATFRVTGFLDYAYFTQYEDEDPYLTGQKNCERYYEEKGTTRSSSCGNITFTAEDSVNGPMHTDDSALVECSNKVSFGRKSHTPYDAVEINGGTWSESSTKATKKPTESPCPAGSRPEYNTENKEYSQEGHELHAPPSDTSLRAYIESGYEFTGLTTLTLEGENVKVKNANYNGGVAKSIPLPENGLIFVQAGSKGCSYEYSQGNNGSDTSTTEAKEAECGSVYVKGNYNKSLTIGAEDDLIINGNITPTGLTAGETPSATDTTTLGLMATRFVRVYHPCNGSDNLEKLWIYGAILSTSHSFLVDNYECGNSLGKLNVYGAIAQKFRGVVGTTGGTGYLKDYIYDERLATDEPPYFLAPLDAGWEIARETSPTGG
jgi:Tfp pilus assembly protein PilX